MPYVRRLLVLLVMTIVAGCSNEEPAAENPVAGLRVAALLGSEADAGYKKATGPISIAFPRDHGPHPGYRSEWWYLTAVLKDAAGNDYGLHYTLFRQALTPEPTGAGPWQTGQAYLAHLAVTDVSRGEHVEAERFARGHPSLAGVRTGAGFAAVIEDWSLSGATVSGATVSGGTNGGLSLVLAASEVGQFAVELSISQTHPIVLQGDRGFSEKGEGSASYYYSMPRLQVSGTLSLAGQSIDVAGLGWLDREWSTSLLGDYLSGWDWFALQLDDQRSLMAFQLRRKDGARDSYDHGLLVDHRELPDVQIADHGTPGVTLLKPTDFRLTPLRFFTDSTGVSWPVSWQLQLADEQLTIHAMLDDQRMDLSIVYWEGMVEVRNADGHAIGRGYMELTGYGDQ